MGCLPAVPRDEGTQTITYRSWIHHNVLGNYNWPIDIGCDYFAFDKIRYHGQDLTIIWDKPNDGSVHCGSVPEGYSVYVDGTRVFTVDRLVHLIWDSATGNVTFPESCGTITYNVANDGLKAASEVVLSGRIPTYFQKAGASL